ncbi:MAG: hypothetical protein M1337_01405 [Actinobacteria bacterium]|nr:hypothetical protein [Actinomycetota bacterium]
MDGTVTEVARAARPSGEDVIVQATGVHKVLQINPRYVRSGRDCYEAESPQIPK